MRVVFAGALLALTAAMPVQAQERSGIRYFEEVCSTLSDIDDACTMVQAAAEMLSPTYEEDKAGQGEARLRALGYAAEYIPARHGFWSDTTDVFLIAKPRSDRLYVVITGTESLRDWYENAKAVPYTTVWRDGYFYTPPGHAGFRSGALNVIGDVLRRNEFDSSPLSCNGREAPRGASRLARFLCTSEVRSSEDRKVQVVLAGHSRGSAVAALVAPAFAGYEIRIASDGSAAVAPQAHWPLEFAGLIGFAPPQAIYTRTDAAAGVKLPQGAPNQWEVYDRAGIIPRTMVFLNDRDIVPLLSLGLGRQIGHRFRITESGRLEYVGYNSLNSVNVLEAHGSGGYCHDVLAAFRRPDEDLRCDERTYSEPGIKRRLGEEDVGPPR